MLRAGNYINVACMAVGVSKATLYNWLGRDEPEYRAFAERIDKARAEGEARHVALIAKAAADDWRASAWLLERQHPDRWGKPQKQADVPADPTETAPTPSDPLDAIDAQVIALPTRRR
jgi:transposase